MSDGLQAVIEWDDDIEQITCLSMGISRTNK